MVRTLRRRRTRTARLNEEPPRELDFNAGDESTGRAGDPRSEADVQAEFPAERVRQAGMTGGETAAGEVTADDMAPETLLDEDLSRTPGASAGRDPIDTILHEADETDIDEGQGLDEAGLARGEVSSGRARGKPRRRR